MREWKAPVRNWKGIQFGTLRKKVDPKFNEAHDVLSKAFYEKKEFIWKGKNWGILDKQTFDMLHGLIFHKRAVAFHKANRVLPVNEQIPEERYNYERDEIGTIVGRQDERAQAEIDKLKREGIELEV